MTTEELRESLLMEPKNGFARITPEQRADMEGYAKRYMAFMDECSSFPFRHDLRRSDG